MNVCMDSAPMVLTTTLTEWLRQREWEDVPDIDTVRMFARVETAMEVDSQVLKVYLEADEKAERFLVYLYSPFNVPPDRFREVAGIVNRVNVYLSVGRFCVSDERDAIPVQFMASIDVEGSMLTTTQIENLLGYGINAFERFGRLLATLSVTDIALEDAWANFLADEERARVGTGGDAPGALN
jgi:hypothetical protein